MGKMLLESREKLLPGNSDWQHPFLQITADKCCIKCTSTKKKINLSCQIGGSVWLSRLGWCVRNQKVIGSDPRVGRVISLLGL